MRYSPFGISTVVLVIFGLYPGMISGSSFASSAPVITTVFPQGLTAGKSTEVEILGTGLEAVDSLISDIPGFVADRIGDHKFRIEVPKTTRPGYYDLSAFGRSGISAPVPFVVGRLESVVELSESAGRQLRIPLDVSIDGRILVSGEIDRFAFEIPKGQRVVFECIADRIDSKLRAVLSLHDESGRRIAVNRGYFGVDPRIEWTATESGRFELRIHDLTYGGGQGFVYRIDVITGDQPLFALPCQIPVGKDSKIDVFGRFSNSDASRESEAHGDSKLDRVAIEISRDLAQTNSSVPMRRSISQSVIDFTNVELPGTNRPFPIGVGDIEARVIADSNGSPSKAVEIECPGDVCGSFATGSNQRWFALNARQGESFWFEIYSERLGTPTDLQLGIYDSAGESELTSFSDVHDLPESTLPTGHSDPEGRWTAPKDGRFLIALRETKNGLDPDPRKVYLLSVRRDVPDFRVIAIPSAGSINIESGGRTAIELIALRKRGFSGPIRVFPERLPAGMSCPEIWIGPNTDRAILTVSGDSSLSGRLHELDLVSEANGVGRHAVPTATSSLGSGPVIRGRLVSKSFVAVTGKAALRVEADSKRPFAHPLYGTMVPSHSLGGFVDVAVRIDRRDPSFESPVRLRLDGLPPQLGGSSVELRPGTNEGWLSLALPSTLAPGPYSFVVRAETTVTGSDPSKPDAVVAFSEPLTIEVRPAAFRVEIDPFTVRKVKRGENFKIRYTVRRQNGFIGKVHTELAIPGVVTNVPGVRGRGETFVGQTEEGSINVVIDPNAPLGRVQFARLLTVGVVEDEAIHQGAEFLELEIVE
ncbi:hypothetical protein FGO68_gene11363 [Halteria grandinella]|uniref:Peptidase C-terminal archaeal/bacterial domain-containing protein n=1 Tax=Halteria grandinella TaxID=5974 RepID=A0A8J8NBS6_HALGN|nr:hypothetical protein FGO68_gene11363 [Halteria grandinella]